MSQENMCKALVQQGERAGERCQKKSTDNGFCVYHQRNYEYEQLLAQNKKLCGMFFRGCNTELSDDDLSNNYKNCAECRLKKSGKTYKCQYDKCEYSIKNEEDKYCKKHIRQHLRDNEQNTGIKYCDIARGCFNKITSGNKCEECKITERKQVASEIDILRQKYNIEVQPVKLYNNLHHMQEQYTISIAEMWRSTQRNAYSRGLLFTITEQEYENLIIRPCYYCGFYSSSRLNGIDRIDNNKGYIVHNCITCCKMCNMIKHSQHPLEFLEKVNAIKNFTSNKIVIPDSIIKTWKSYLSKSPRTSYKDYKFQSKERKIEFVLTEQEYNKLIGGNCYLCGIKNSKYHTNGIDRFDNTLRVYSIDNCKTCCGHCNLMKGTFSYDDFIEKCIQINSHACNRDTFTTVPVYDNTYCRNEFYTADDIYNMMINGKYSKYIEWCREKEKTPEFISSINIICNTDNLSESNKTAIIKKIQDELDRERHRDSDNLLDEKKMLQCTTVYAYLTQGKVSYFKEWFSNNYSKTSLFDEQLDTLLDSLPSMTKEEGIKACKKLMHDEKNRRSSQVRREREKKVVQHTTKIKNATQSTNTSREQKKASIKEETIQVYISDDTSSANSIENVVIESQNKVGYQKKTTDNIKQWKVKQIYNTICENNENTYKEYCEANNDISKIPDWDTKWTTFVLSIKGKSYQQSEEIIRELIEDLRRIRHNELCYNKNASVVDRDDRQQWPATTVVRAFLDGKIDTFKKYTEEQTGDNPGDAAWQTRWNGFIKTLEDNKDNHDILKDLCSKFMTAQRTKRYRRNTTT
jgi:hypothetical protein